MPAALLLKFGNILLGDNYSTNMFCLFLADLLVQKRETTWSSEKSEHLPT